MKFPSFTLTPLIICFVIGVLYSFEFGIQHSFTNPILLVISFLGLVIAWLFKQKYSVFFPIILCALSFFIGINRGYQVLKKKQNHYSIVYLEKDQNEFIIEITERLRPTAWYERYYGNVILLNHKKASGKLLIRIKKEDSLELGLGSFIKTSATITPIQSSNTLGGFNYKEYLSSIEIYHQLNINAFESIEESDFSLMSWIRKLKQRKLNSIESSSLKEETKQLLMALILGERNELDRIWTDRYAQAGIIHILAISGLHMGLLMVLLGWLFRPLGLLSVSNYTQVFLIIMGLWAYAFLTGANSSVVRAATLFSLYCIGNYIKRSPPTLYLLLLSFGLLIYINPMFIKQLGFQMSYFAVFGILTLQPAIVKLLPTKKGLIHRFWVMTTVTLAAQIAVSPLAIHNFNQFPGLFLLTNWIILPCVAIFLYLGLGSLILLHWKPLPNILIQLLDSMTSSMNNLVLWVVDQEAFFFEQIRLNTYELFLSYALLIFIYLVYLNSKKSVLLNMLVIIFVLQCLSFKSNLENKRMTAVWILAAYNNSVMFYKKEETLTVHSSDPINEDHSIIIDFQKEYSIKDIAIEPLKNSYTIEDKTLVFIDSLWSEHLNFTSDDTIIILTKNTKINLDALLQKNEIKQVIVDGSSYPNIKKRWKKTCTQYNVPFHDTQKEGNFLFSTKTRNIAF